MTAVTKLRRAFLAVCVLQLVTIFERQIIDFMGYMWLCIGLNFLHVICTILAIFGSLQYRSSYLAIGLAWNSLWIGWNAFVICLHLDVGLLHKDMQILNLGTGTPNWWMVNAPGCTVTYDFSSVDPITFRAKVSRVENCVLEYQYIEVIHSALQAVLSLLAFVFGSILVHLFKDRGASSFDDPVKPFPVPGYTLSLQHSLATDRFEATIPRPTGQQHANANRANINSGTYDRVHRKSDSTNNTYGTTRSGRSNHNSSQRSRKPVRQPAQETFAQPKPMQGVDNIRVSTSIPPLIHSAELGSREDFGGSIYGAYGTTSVKRELSPTENGIGRPMSTYHPNPGSVSPYNRSRGPNEASF